MIQIRYGKKILAPGSPHYMKDFSFYYHAVTIKAAIRGQFSVTPEKEGNQYINDCRVYPGIKISTYFSGLIKGDDCALAASNRFLRQSFFPWQLICPWSRAHKGQPFVFLCLLLSRISSRPALPRACLLYS